MTWIIDNRCEKNEEWDGNGVKNKISQEWLEWTKKQMVQVLSLGSSAWNTNNGGSDSFDIASSKQPFSFWSKTSDHVDGYGDKKTIIED